MALKAESVVDKIEREAGVQRELIPCATPGCGGPAFAFVDDRNLCQRCYEGQLNTAAFERCKARGLVTVDDMRAYCRRILKRGVFSKPSFERWAEFMTQKTVDWLVMRNDKDDHRVLDRLRALGALDENNKLVPLEERAARRAKVEAERKAERERIDAALKAQGIVRSDVDALATAVLESRAPIP